MSSNNAFQLVAGNGRFRGFDNLLHRENQKWWPLRSALTRALIWIVLLNGILAAALFVFPTMTDPEGNLLFTDDPLQMSSTMFVGLAAVGLSIGIIVMMQDAIIEEKQMGTAAWILSKPVSRQAFLSAKLVASVVGMICLMIIPSALVAYGLFWLYEPGAYTWTNFVAMIAVVTLHALFYLTLTLMMGTLTNRRGILLAVALGSLMGGGMVPIQALVQISPWQLQQVGVMALEGIPLDSMALTMLVATAVWCILFLVVAAWQFERAEF
ncbi:MAG: ABC transporter permease subunit [Chloroflexi bacterium]|nr:ABC transporter permease subunit [Chloroflexota bacterium]